MRKFLIAAVLETERMPVHYCDKTTTNFQNAPCICWKNYTTYIQYMLDYSSCVNITKC